MESLYWSLGGLAGMGIGIGTAAAIQEDNGTAAAVVGVTGVVIGLVGLVGALVAQPSGEAQFHDRINAAQRRTCGGK